MIQRVRSLADISNDAKRILYRELGVIETIRYLSQFRAGCGNYAVDRDQWESHLTVADIATAIKEMKQGQATTPKQELEH